VSVAFRPLLPPAGGTVTAEEYVASLDLRSQATEDRPYVGLNMIATLDGRATIAGRTAPIANRADYELFHALRAGADAVLVGAHTVRVEGYGAMDQAAVVVSRSLDLPTERGLLSYPGNRVIVVTSNPGELPGCAADLSYVRTADLREALRTLRAEHGIRAVVCEGGPHLNAGLLPDGLVDELFLAIAPMLAGGPDPLTILTGGPLDPPLEAQLRGLLESGGYLFARYGLSGRRRS
jgi:riboflavin biosynthesis pyrimidine reductase